MRFKLGLNLGSGTGGGVVSDILFWLTNVLNLTTTVGSGPAVFDRGDSAVTVPAFDATTGLELATTPINVVASPGMRYDTGVWYNDDGSGNALHPVKVVEGADVYLQYNYWPGATQVVGAGAFAYVVGTDNHNYALSTTAGGTTGGSLPSVAAGDLGSTVSDGSVTWDVNSYYSNLATATSNFLPGIAHQPAFTQYFVLPEAPANQTISLGTGTFDLLVWGSDSAAIAANTATGTGFGSATPGAPITVSITGAGTVDVTVTGTPLFVGLQSAGVTNVSTLNPTTTTAVPASLETIANPLPANLFATRGRAKLLLDSTSGTRQYILSERFDANNVFLVFVQSSNLHVKQDNGTGLVTSTSAIAGTFLAGDIINWGAAATATELISYFGGVPDASPAAVKADRTLAGILEMASNSSTQHISNVTDYAVSNGSDLEGFASDITWSQP